MNALRAPLTAPPRAWRSAVIFLLNNADVVIAAVSTDSIPTHDGASSTSLLKFS
jgi:hypothetical protein